MQNVYYSRNPTPVELVKPAQIELIIWTMPTRNVSEVMKHETNAVTRFGPDLHIYHSPITQIIRHCELLDH